MMIGKRVLCASASVCAVLASTGAASAQTASDSSVLGDIVVTARRVEERLQDVPISITAFSQDQITERNISTPADLATYTPSLTINQQFGPEKSSFIIRGFTQEIGTSPSVGTYFADVVSPRAQGGTTSGNSAGNLFDLQNVQVLKGPQGTLFGRNTTGGAVLVVPRKPTDRLEGYVEGSLGNFDLWRLQAVLNVPLSDNFLVRLGVDRQKRDGYMINHGTGPDFNDLDYTALRLSIVAKLSPDLESYTVASYNRSSTNGFGSHLIGCGRSYLTSTNAALIFQRTIAPLACAQRDRMVARGDSLTDVETFAPNPFLKTETWQVINTTTWIASDALTIKNIASYSEYRERASFSLFADNFLTPLSPTLGAIPFIYLNPGKNEDNASQSTFTEELQFQGRAWGDKLIWQAGAYLEVSNPLGFSAGLTQTLVRCTNVYERQCATAPEFGPLGPAFGTLSAAAAKTRFNNKGFYAQGTFNLTDRLAVTGGIRYTIDKTTGISESTVYRFPTPNNPVQTCNDVLRFQGPGRTPLVVSNRSQCHFEIGIKSEKPTWLIDLQYKPTEDVMFYGKYTRGYRQGGVIMSNIGLEAWEPETVDTFEAGAKTQFRGAISGYFNVAAFYNNFRNQQIQGNLVSKPGEPRAGTAIINAGKSRIWGIEVDSAVEPVRGLRFDLGYTYLNTELLEIVVPTLSADSPFASINPTAVVGDPLSYSPRHRLTATGSYTLPLDEAIGAIKLGVTYTHTAAQNASARPTTPFYRLQPTDLFNVNVDWKDMFGQPIDAALFVTNLTNKKYISAMGGGWLFAGFQSVNVGQPRMWGARLRYRFGN